MCVCKTIIIEEKVMTLRGTWGNTGGITEERGRVGNEIILKRNLNFKRPSILKHLGYQRTQLATLFLVLEK